MRTLIFVFLAAIIGSWFIWNPVYNKTAQIEYLTCSYVDAYTCLIREANKPEVLLADISHLSGQEYKLNEKVVYAQITPTETAWKQTAFLLLVLGFILAVRFLVPLIFSDLFLFLGFH